MADGEPYTIVCKCIFANAFRTRPDGLQKISDEEARINRNVLKVDMRVLDFHGKSGSSIDALSPTASQIEHQYFKDMLRLVTD